jgi:anthranilate 1,2-dioxygenase small subunit
MELTADLRGRVDDLFCDYAFCIDDDNPEIWPDFFTDDGLYEVTTKESDQRGLPMAIMRCKGMGQIRDRITALRKANIFEDHHYNHIISRPRLTANGDGSIHARTSIVVYRTMHDGKQERFVVASYDDEIVEQAGELKFKKRRVVLDSRRVDVLLVYPL